MLMCPNSFELEDACPGDWLRFRSLEGFTCSPGFGDEAELGKCEDKSSGSTFILCNCPGQQGQAVTMVTASDTPGDVPSAPVCQPAWGERRARDACE